MATVTLRAGVTITPRGNPARVVAVVSVCGVARRQALILQSGRVSGCDAQQPSGRQPLSHMKDVKLSRNSLYLVIALLAVVAVGFGIYLMYQENQKPALEIKVDGQGITVK